MKQILQHEWKAYKQLMSYPSMALTLMVMTVMSMNLLANKELLHTSWIALDCGFALSWITFLIMDCVCWKYGGRMAFRISLIAIVMNLLMFALFKLILLTPGMWGEYYATGLTVVNEALNHTIGGSTWIVLGSALAMVVASGVNSLVHMLLARWVTSRGYGGFAVRSFVSTGVSQFVDNLIFALVVSVPLFGWTIRQTFMCAFTCAMAELALEVCFSHVGYRLSSSERLSDGTGRAASAERGNKKIKNADG